MAITGTLTADFASFFDACEKAQVSLRGFESSTGKVESSLNRMVDNFSGRKIISEATLMAEAVERVGGVSKLTAAELQRIGAVAAEAGAKLTAWGQEVPKNISDLAVHAKTATGNLEGMLGVATKLAGAFGIAFSIGAIVNFGREILADADALTKLHDKSGISVEVLQAMRIAGDDAGTSLDSMVAAVNMLQKRLGGDSNSANAALLDLGINIAEFRKLDGGQQMVLLSDAVRGMNDPLRVAADLSALFGKSWAEQLPALKRGFKELRDGTVLYSADTVQALDDVGDALTRMSRAAKGDAAEAFAFMFLGWGKPAREAKREADELAAALKSMGAEAAKNAPSLGGLVPPGLPKDLKEIEAGLTASAEAGIIAHQAFAKWTAAMVELNAAGTTWHDTLDGIDGSVVEAVQHYLAAGVSQTALATAYALSATQIKAIASALVDKLAASKSMMEFEDAAAKREFEIRNLQTKATNDAVLGRLKEQQASDAAFAAMQAGALTAIRAEEALNNTVKAVTGSYWAQVDAAAAAAGVTVIGHRPDEGGGINMGGAPNLSKSSFSLGGPFSLTTPLPVSSHAAGGPVSAGLSMLHDNEYVVPENGALVLRGGGGSVVYSPTFNLYGTPESMLKQVDERMMRLIKSATKLAGSA